MANINTNGFIIAAISIIVSIILVTGVLIPVIADNSGTERTVLYTNTGEWYYNEVTNDVNTTIAFELYDNNSFPELKITVNDNQPIESEIPEWTSDSSMNVTTLPLFIFKTNDSKYGVEGLVTCCGGDISADPEYLEKCGIMYYRSIHGDSEPVRYYTFNDEISSFSVTLSNGQVTISNIDVPSINAEYELYLTGQTSGDYVLTNGNNPTVIDSTDFYCCGWCGDSSMVFNEDDEPEIVYNNIIGTIGEGKISTIISNTTFYFIDGSTGQSFELETQPTADEKGTVIEGITITGSDDSSIGVISSFIVPVEVVVSGDSAVSPTLRSMISIIPLIVIVGLIVGTVGYFMRRQ